MTALAWTDGSARNKDKSKGGYGIVLRLYDNTGFLEELTVSGGTYDNVTSAQMEIISVRELMKIVNDLGFIDHLTVYNDNQYVINTIRLGWLDSWIADPMFKGKANPHLWRQVHYQLKKFKGKLHMQWVKGHAGLLENEMADILAKAGGQKKK